MGRPTYIIAFKHKGAWEDTGIEYTSRKEPGALAESWNAKDPTIRATVVTPKQFKHLPR